MTIKEFFKTDIKDLLRFVGYSDLDIERTLRTTGEIPEEIAQGYADIERIDLRSSNLLFLRSKFIARKISFAEYSNLVCTSFVQTLMNRKI